MGIIIPRAPGYVRNFAVRLPQIGVALNLDANNVDLSRNYPWDDGQSVGTNPMWRNSSQESTHVLDDAQMLGGATEPILHRGRPDSVVFNGTTDMLFVPNSTGSGTGHGFFNPQINGICDIIIALRISSYPVTTGGIVGNTRTPGEEGFAVYISSIGMLHFDLQTFAGPIVQAVTTTPIPLNQLIQIRILADGSNVWFFYKYKPYSSPIEPFVSLSQVDGPIPYTGSLGVSPATNNISIGSASGDIGPDRNFGGELFYLILADRSFYTIELGLLDAFLDDKLVQR